MGGCLIKTGNRQIVHKMLINEGVLDKVAEALGFLPAERREFIAGTESIHVYRGDRPTRGRGIRPTRGAAPSPPSGGAPPSPTRGRRRPSG